MTSLETPTNKKKVRSKGFTIHEDIRHPLAILSQNISRPKTRNEGSDSHLTEESKRAISILINKHERTKSELQDKNASEEKIKCEVQELRAQVEELQSTIKHDQDVLRELNSQAEVEMAVQELSNIPDTQEALLETLIKKEADIDRELFQLRDDKVIARGELWFAMMGKVDESIEHPDQASRDRNLLKRKEIFLLTKRSVANDTKAKLLSAKEDIQKQKFEILQDPLVEGYQQFREASPFSEDSDQDSSAPESRLQLRGSSPIPEESDEDSILPNSQLGDDGYQINDSIAESDEQNQDSSWLTENENEPSPAPGFLYRRDGPLAAEKRLALVQEIQTLKLNLHNAEAKLRKSERKSDRFRIGTRATIERLSSELASTQESLEEVVSLLDESDDLRKQLVHKSAKLQEDKSCLLILAQEIALPVLARTAEHMKKIKREGVHMTLHNSLRSFDREIDEAGNIAATGGHVNAHFASIVLAEKEVIGSDLLITGEMFLTMYGVSVGEYRHLYYASKKLDEILNMHAILVECGCFTDLTLSKTRDLLFQNQFAQCLLEFEAIDAPTPEGKGRIFDNAVGSDRVELFKEMLQITQDIEVLYQAAI